MKRPQPYFIDAAGIARPIGGKRWDAFSLTWRVMGSIVAFMPFVASALSIADGAILCVLCLVLAELIDINRALRGSQS